MQVGILRKITPGKLSMGNCPRTIPTLDNYPLPPGQFPPRTITTWPIAPQAIPTDGNYPRSIAPWTISSDNSDLGLLYCPSPFRIITPWQLLHRAMTIRNYNFFMTIFCFFSMAQLYNFCHDNKNNNDNSNKTWSLKLLSVIIL